jgi:hypothetical protein
VIPGNAKPRSELPWLPYRETDKVFVINSHNFGGGAFDPSVNGKTPIAAWVPSRDDAGNGTTTLTDLVGTNNGTLTNMDPATDWLVDTGSGGVRALDFDGVNDAVIASAPAITQQMTQSYWFRRAAPSVLSCFVGFGVASTVSNRFVIQPWSDGVVYISFGGSNWGQLNSNDTNWHHLVAVFDGSATGNANRLKAYLDGSPVSLSYTATIPSAIGAPSSLWMGRTFTTINQFSSGRIDDYRLWDVALNATDAADLYAAQRGGNA